MKITITLIILTLNQVLFSTQADQSDSNCRSTSVEECGSLNLQKAGEKETIITLRAKTIDRAYMLPIMTLFGNSLDRVPASKKSSKSCDFSFTDNGSFLQPVLKYLKF